MDKLIIEQVGTVATVKNAKTGAFVCTGDPFCLQDLVKNHNNEIDSRLPGQWWVDLEGDSTINVGMPPNDSVIASGDAEILDMIVGQMNRSLNLFNKIRLGSTLPTRGSDGSGGYDLYAPHDFTLRPDDEDATIIKTGIGVVLPQGHCAQFWCRSSLGKKRVIVHGGFIDYDYRNELGVMLSCVGPKAISFSAGDRIAQCAIVPCLMPGVVEHDRRGGFGSTGK